MCTVKRADVVREARAYRRVQVCRVRALLLAREADAGEVDRVLCHDVDDAVVPKHIEMTEIYLHFVCAHLHEIVMASTMRWYSSLGERRALRRSGML